MGLTLDQIERYSRQILLKQVGGKGQEKLLASRVLIVGAGGLGSPASMYLAAAGVGTIGLIDSDDVDITNLQRQIVHFTEDIGTPKVDSAARKLLAINPDVRIQTFRERAVAANVLDIIRNYDFVLDGTDNFPTKFLINDACYLAGVPFSHAGILRFDGQLFTVIPGKSACYRCIFAGPPPAGAVPSCSQAGVLGAVAGVIGCLQAAEALKYLLGVGELLTDRMLVFDALAMSFREVRLRRNPRCPLCGESPTITELQDIEQVACDLRTRGAATAQDRGQDESDKVQGARRDINVEKNGVIELPAEILAEMVRQAREEAPLEACGLLAGREGRARRYYRMTNIDHSPEHFSMAPQEQFAAVKDMRKEQMELLAICHSHPNTPARLSEEDLRLAFTPGVVHIVVSLARPDMPDVRGFRVENGKALEQTIKVVEEK